MSVDPLLNRIGPLLIGNRHILQGPSHHLAEAVDDLMDRERFAYQRKHFLQRQTGICQDGCGNAGNILTAKGNVTLRSSGASRTQDCKKKLGQLESQIMP